MADQKQEVKYELCSCGIAGEECEDHISPGKEEVLADCSCQENKERCPARIREEQCDNGGGLGTAGTDKAMDTENRDQIGVESADRIKELKQAHSDERPFSCSKCQYSYKTMGHLRKHLKTVHFEERPFSCSQCQYRCMTKYDLAQHMKQTHCDERPFSCCQCQYSCKTKSSLSAHTKQIHSEADERPFSCSQCQYRCKTNSVLTKHLSPGPPPSEPTSVPNSCFSTCRISKHFKVSVLTSGTNDKYRSMERSAPHIW